MAVRADLPQADFSLLVLPFTAMSDDAIEKRVYIGGLHSSVTDQLLHDRFNRYGTISSATVAKDDQGNCRGFGHLTITTTPKQWAGCLSVYNGAKWKGMVMRLEDAKPDYKERKRKEDEQLRKKEERQQRKRLRLEKRFLAKDMTPVTDKNMEKRRGWRRGRYGRAIAIMHLRRPDGTQIVFDPSHYKNNLTKLYNINARMKPVSRLPMQYDDYASDSNDRYDDTIYDQDKSDHEDNMDKGDEKRLAAMERRMAEAQQKHEMISRALNSDDKDRTNHVTFDKEEEEEEVDEDDQSQQPRPSSERPAPRDSSWLFDSDEDEGDLEIKMNPVLEGEKGRERLALQSTFKGDERFKLDEDFIDEDETKKTRNEENIEEDEITRDLNAEKDQSMDVLRAMFGEETVNKTKKRDTQWTSGARYDPEAEDADQYLRKAESSEEEREHSEEEALPVNTAPVTAMPVVSKDKHFEVNVNMKPLFAAEEGPFKLFGGDDEDDVENDTKQQPLFGNMLDSDDEEDVATTTKSKKHAQLGLGVMFFFHTDNPSLMAKSCFDYDPNGIFQRSESEDFESIWQEKRPQITDYLKKRQRRALKRNKKQNVKSSGQ
ncbi:hypothetical protein RO3G_07180 [Lichtheimia corymbifera JMRC:FSU:9682]|uniref:RRM domain-containing protein n=1 Tax=Lichtheimia corymbifera JMRC:FSU:9682 TaxID=1263082 RepID=A0A068RGQ8_9FUNG|nr:hypothetical protein RO3G_07180 [Lichtheimia corymbifera JMRC:FSU:9682]